MTAYSLRILEFPTGASSVELESSTLKADVAQALSRYAGGLLSLSARKAAMSRPRTLARTQQLST